MTRLGLILAIALGIVSLPGVISGSGAEQFPDKAKARIIISQDKQQMLIYEGELLVKQFPISTGWPGVRKTQTPEWVGRVGEFWGTFESFGTTQDLGYWLYTDYLPDGSWNGDILIHGAPYTVNPAGAKSYSKDHIGKMPASHGCIQLLPEDAEWFHRWDPIGVPITIRAFTGGTLIYPKIVFGAQLTGASPTGQSGEPTGTALTLP
jgi:lipoprotein-anchoring transpeptidase ErfK/SrfK